MWLKWTHSIAKESLNAEKLVPSSVDRGEIEAKLRRAGNGNIDILLCNGAGPKRLRCSAEATGQMATGGARG